MPILEASFFSFFFTTFYISATITQFVIAKSVLVKERPDIINRGLRYVIQCFFRKERLM